ncbi:cytochrome P450 714C2-like [Malania oleifera]|uniref:cytochrome P450 714C2-like n=1 Tax=Malania oleifera TaxID=397392 RepID=UPI0025ADB62B|nr:cytochrome P450 714C2-like [Malania oleifera]
MEEKYAIAAKALWAIAVLGLGRLLLRLLEAVWLKPRRVRLELAAQGITGPPPYFLLGNIPQLKSILSSSSSTQAAAAATEGDDNGGNAQMQHAPVSALFPFLHQWREKYGKMYTFSLGVAQVVYVTDPEVAKEITLNTSPELGKPSYGRQEYGALLGQGIVAANGSLWVHERKNISPELYMDKVKVGMVGFMGEAAMNMVANWERKVDREGGATAEINVDEHLRTLSTFVISKTLFGDDYCEGLNIFSKLSHLQELLSTRATPIAIPGLAHLPTKSNREKWRLKREIHSMILKIARDRMKGEPKNDLLQKIIDGGSRWEEGAECEQYIVDNCKNVYLAGYETSAVAAAWTIMLLAAHPDWQAKARLEVQQVCGNHAVPDANMLTKMKLLTCIIQEALRLYPPCPVVPREALQNMKLKNIHIPKGVTVWLSSIGLHQDPQLWGPDTHTFNPQRFANGLHSATNFPQLYIPFGVGPRICAGQNFALVEIKMLLSAILSKFSFSLSPKYRHAPVRRLIIVPEHGVNITIKKL